MGVIVVVPIPRLLISLKFKTVKDCAAPTTGIYVPSSWMKIPSLKFGVKVTQRIPFASRFKNAPFTPGEFAESKIFASIFTLPDISSLCSGRVLPIPTEPMPVTMNIEDATPTCNFPVGFVVPTPTLSLTITVPITSSSSLGWVVAIPTRPLTIAVPYTSSSWRAVVILVVPIPTLSASNLIKSWGAL